MRLRANTNPRGLKRCVRRSTCSSSRTRWTRSSSSTRPGPSVPGNPATSVASAARGGKRCATAWGREDGVGAQQQRRPTLDKILKRLFKSFSKKNPLILFSGFFYRNIYTPRNFIALLTRSTAQTKAAVRISIVYFSFTDQTA